MQFNHRPQNVNTNVLNAAKCNLTELTTRSACSIPGQRCARDAHVPRTVMLWDQCAS